MSELILFASSFVNVFALGLQNLNVTRGHYWLAFFTSFPIGVSFLIGVTALPGATWTEYAAFLLGGAIGIVFAMWIHPRMVAVIDRRRASPPPRQSGTHEGA